MTLQKAILEENQAAESEQPTNPILYHLNAARLLREHYLEEGPAQVERYFNDIEGDWLDSWAASEELGCTDSVAKSPSWTIYRLVVTKITARLIASANFLGRNQLPKQKTKR